MYKITTDGYLHGYTSFYLIISNILSRLISCLQTNQLLSYVKRSFADVSSPILVYEFVKPKSGSVETPDQPETIQ